MNSPGSHQTVSAPGLIIAAPRSGSGKTMLTLGLMRAFRNAGLRVGGAKCGPDYIDPAFHAAATGMQSFNLDSWAMRPSLIHALATAAGDSCDVVLCEASMGLFDGAPGARGRTGSSADVAAALGWPILLVVDVSGQAQTAAAIVKGCAAYDSRIQIAGVALNRVASDRHRRLAADAIESAGFKVLGALPRMEQIHLPERHLGLVQANETPDIDLLLDRIAEFVGKHIDLNAVIVSARAASCSAGDSVGLRPPAQRIAIARDEAFSFLYPHILAGWRMAGAEICFFSPLADEGPPEDCAFCWLPGGYPELHAGRLASAAHFINGLRQFARSKPIHGECGGYMVLGQALIDGEGRAHRMVGLLGPTFSFAKRALNLGYRRARLADAHSLGPSGAWMRGHEFHYATIDAIDAGDQPFAFLTDAHGGAERAEGSRRGAVSGSFFHIIAPGED